ncbi:MAG: hypothetical protein OEZ04_00580 [Nitrospinota bacterium]|nr:hypothetical protein [Nitrospinota bacterium]
MLIIISDLHFSDGTAGDHNVRAKAFTQVFMRNIISNIKSNPTGRVTLLLLGDIFELARSTKWFENADGTRFDMEDRPWGATGRADVTKYESLPKATQSGRPSATETKLLEILGRFPDSGQRGDVAKGSILEVNWNALEFFRTFPHLVAQGADIDIPVEVVYLPGNHDRMANLYPSVCREVKRILGLPGDDNWFDHEYYDEEFHVFARHGHEHDPFNYSRVGSMNRTSHMQLCIGDILATEFAVRLPWEVKSQSGLKPRTRAKLVKQLEDLDNLRPLNSAMEWLYYKVREENTKVAQKALDRAFDNVAREILSVEFFRTWESSDTRLDDLARAATHPWLRWLTGEILTKLDTGLLLSFFNSRSDFGDSGLENGAFQEARYGKPEAKYVVYGHTHEPTQKPLDVRSHREVMYLNAGTWRSRIVQTSKFDRTPDYISLKQMSYILFSSDGGKPRMDMWMGTRKEEE